MQLLHRCRFVPFVPSAVNAMCYASSPIPRLACVRANGNIEIWDPVDWVLERTIPGITGAGSIESIAWVYPKDEIFSDDDDDEDEHQPEQSVKPSTRKPSHSETMEPMLVTAGLDGIVSVWDLEALTPKFSIDSGGGAVWSLAVAPVYGEESSAGAEIAVACEDGVVRLFTISPTLGISFKAACARQDARILSLAYHPTKPLISAGSADSCIRAYSTSTYRLVWRITVDTAVSTAPARRKSKRNGSANVADGEGLGGGTRQDTLVWALAYLPSGTLVAGDSLGVVSFWDDASATLIKALRAHHADVLCLAVGSNQDEPVVFSSGVDRRVLQFRLVENSAAAHIGYMQRVRDRRNQQQDSQSDKTWVLVGDRRFHSHDVRALVLCDEKPVDALVSAGVDSALIVTKSAVRQFSDTKQPQNKRPQLRVGMFPQRPIVSVAEGARLVLARFDSSVKLWRLGQAASLNELEDTNVKDGERVGLTKKEKLVAEIKIKSTTNLTASAISPDGNLVAVSDLHCTRLFRVSSAQHTAKISRLRKFPSPGLIPGSTAILFTKDSKMLILAGSDCVVRVIDVSETSSDTSFGILGAFSEHAANTQNGLEIGTSNCRKENICTLAVSGDSQWLATGDLANRIYVFNLDNMKLQTVIPRQKPLHTALAFPSTNGSVLALALSSNEVYLFDIEHPASRNSAGGARLTQWSRQNSHLMPLRVFGNRSEPIIGIASCGTNAGKLVVWGQDFVCSIDMRVPLSGKVRQKRKLELAKSSKKQNGVVNGKSTDEESDDENAPNGHINGNSVSSSSTTSFIMNTNYGPILNFGFLGETGEAVVVERPVLSVLDALPRSFYRKTYGT